MVGGVGKGDSPVEGLSGFFHGNKQDCLMGKRYDSNIGVMA